MESSSDNSRELGDVISGWIEIAMFVLRDEHTLLPGFFLPACLKLVYGIIAVKLFDKKYFTPQSRGTPDSMDLVFSG
ncbi:hypothetical protein [Nitrosospira sp. Nsp1]|uniref:hypothetical protein n=1 Tax=Nitrosospira sp. Nsp1 TaxID=136547 RepID=UPI00087EB56D|nr:hypothetical protein [Nitrosospira sp. Nsp1]SCX52081.1 hypothetical protein SAMN05720354_11171 [Nitrosospira sp. Nsp1]